MLVKTTHIAMQMQGRVCRNTNTNANKCMHANAQACMSNKICIAHKQMHRTTRNRMKHTLNTHLHKNAIQPKPVMRQTHAHIHPTTRCPHIMRHQHIKKNRNPHTWATSSRNTQERNRKKKPEQKHMDEIQKKKRCNQSTNETHKSENEMHAIETWDATHRHRHRHRHRQTDRHAHSHTQEPKPRCPGA